MIYDQALVDKIKALFTKKNATIAAAESVTSGHIQAALSLAQEASQYYQGGITCYNLGQKVRHLNIEPILADRFNCIHQKIADDMAIEVSKLFLSNYGIAITGYSTIVEANEKEGIFAHVALAFNQKVVVKKRLTSNKNMPLDIQVDYTKQVLNLIYKYLEKNK